MTVIVGKSVPRVEDGLLISGHDEFVGDLRRPDMVHMRVMRSNVARAASLRVDLSDVRRAPGVVGAWNAVDIEQDLGRMPLIPAGLFDAPEHAPYRQPAIASASVSYVGQPIALVVADTLPAAIDAAEHAIVDMDPGEATVDLPHFIDDEAAAILDIAEDFHVTTGDTQRAFEEAPIVVEETFSIGRQSAAPLEPRGLMAEWAEHEGRLHIYGSTKRPHRNRDVVAKALEIQPHRIVMHETAVGGGFGARGELYPEDLLVPWLATKLKQPVMWSEGRRENLISSSQSRRQVHRAAIAGDHDGRILAMRTTCLIDLGAFLTTTGLIPAEQALAAFTTPYAIPSFTGRARCVITNRTPTGTYRAPGRFEAGVVRERLIDMYAEVAELHPIEVRRRNLLTTTGMPHDSGLVSSGVPIVIDEGDPLKMYEQVIERIDQKCIQQMRSRGRAVGVGTSAYLEKSGIGPWESAKLEVDSDGAVLVRTGATSLGQGLMTILTQITAEVLGVPMEDIKVARLDSDEMEEGIGTFGSRSTVMAGNAVLEAAQCLLEDARLIGASHFNVSVEDVVAALGSVQLKRDPGRCLSLGQVAALASPPSGTFTKEVRFESSRGAFASGAVAAAVEVDPETGAVSLLRLIVGYDIGRSINPMLVEGQIHGGAIQAVGGVLLEEHRFDETANPLSTSFVDYLLPTATFVPSIDVILTEERRVQGNRLGVAGAGEAGIPGVAPAIIGAIEDALEKYGLLKETPVTAERIASIASRPRDTKTTKIR